MNTETKNAILMVCLTLAITTPVLAEKAKKNSYSPYVDRDYPENVYFGDTHLHTSISLDAYGDGNTKIGPDEAYRWAKGETIASDNGIPARISRPLDFLMVADHAEYLGLVPGLGRKDPILMKDKAGARWARMIEEGKLKSDVFSEFIHDVTGNKPRIKNKKFSQTVWDGIIDAARRITNRENSPRLSATSIVHSPTAIIYTASSYSVMVKKKRARFFLTPLLTATTLKTFGAILRTMRRRPAVRF